MANNSWVTSPYRNVTVEEWDALLRDVSQHCFGDFIVVEQEGEGYWTFSPNKKFLHDQSYYHSAECWVETPRKLEWRNPYDDWMYWVHSRLQHVLAGRLKSKIGDEGIDPEKIPGDVDWCPKFRDWIKVRQDSVAGRGVKKFVLKSIMKTMKWAVPKGMEPLT
jgi:hypothetical protein